MNSFLICFTLLILSLGGYLIWPSRHYVLQHLAVGGCFVSIIVPALIVQIQNDYPKETVDLYTSILVVGTTAYIAGLILGFVLGKGAKTNFSYDIMDSHDYEQRAISITKILMITGIVGLVLSYMIMGFVPMFADDPISAKLFRGQYQAPYSKVSIIYRASFYIVATIMPIACIIWYRYKSKLFLFCIIAVLLLMAVSLQRSGAFIGIVIAFAIVMSFKSKTHFIILMALLIGAFVLSAFFYFLVGVRAFPDNADLWKIITAGTPDIPDQLDFLVYFNDNPVWTYGRTVYGGLIPGHYKWNPAVYTLTMVNPGADINDIGSGGLRLPLPMWGYVAFSWVGVISFSFLTGLVNGFLIRILKSMVMKFDSLVIKTVGFIAFGTVVGIVANFTLLNMYNFPPAFVCLFYLYRIKLK